MTYQPFTLKYRPQTFSDVVGQDPVATTLKNALREGRVANAFLFTGSRGVGKTSMARILAKALNCPNVRDAEPCNTCDICRSISAGEDLDVLEIDGASNRGIDEIRQIRDNVGYLPARARFKIYIIDEVHMLTMPAFNALLKTLEEPPPHVKFIFATTEFQAVPETIVSRCQRFDFRRITINDLVDRLRHIAKREGIDAAPGVLDEIARKAEGGLRDSVGLLDQIVSFAGSKLGPGDVDRALGHIDLDRLRALAMAIANGDTAATLGALDDAFEAGRDAEDLLGQVLEVFREAMTAAARGDGGPGDGRHAALAGDLRAAMDIDRLLFTVRVLLNALREIRLAGHGRLQLEVALLKLARSVDLVPWQELLQRLDTEEGGDRAAPAAAPPPRETPRHPSPKPPAARKEDAAPPRAAGQGGAGREPAAPAQPEAPPPPFDAVRAAWPRAVALMQSGSSRIAATVEGVEPLRISGGAVVLGLPQARAFLRQSLESPATRDVIERALGEVLGTVPLKIRVEIVAAAPGAAPPPPPKKDVYSDPGVRKIVDALNGGIIHVEQDRS